MLEITWLGHGSFQFKLSTGDMGALLKVGVKRMSSNCIVKKSEKNRITDSVRVIRSSNLIRQTRSPNLFLFRSIARACFSHTAMADRTSPNSSGSDLEMDKNQSCGSLTSDINLPLGYTSKKDPILSSSIASRGEKAATNFLG